MLKNKGDWRKKEPWRKAHYLRVRMYKLAWYYRNRKIINLMFSKPTSCIPDAADIYYLDKHPEG